MNLHTVNEALGWACEALIIIGHQAQKTRGRKDKTLAKLERIARNLAQCRESRPEYATIALTRPYAVPPRFASLQTHRDSVAAALTLVIAAVEGEMRSAHAESNQARPGSRAKDESFAWGMEESPYIASVNEAIGQIEEIEI